MQPSYGVPDIHRQQQNHHHLQQFIENDDCCSSVLPISNPSQNLNHPYQPHLPQQKQPEYIFLQQQQNSIPILHQLFQHQHQPQQQDFRQFQSQEERLYSQIRHQHQQVQAQPPHPPFFSVKFKLGLDQNGGNKECALNQREATDFLNGNEHNPPHVPPVMPHCWHPQEDSTSIKEPFWKPLSRSKNKQQDENGEQEVQRKKNERCKFLDTQQIDERNERCKDLENKYRLFGELEAIYSLAKVGEANQTGSGSALTGETSPTNAGLSVPFNAVHGQNVGAGNAGNGIDHGSENSIGEEAALRKSQKRIRKRKMKKKLSTMAEFFENLVKQVMDHQEILHRNFLEVIERMDKERTKREEAWRCQEAEKYNREAVSRAHEQALASRREAQIVSYVEKITGQSIDLPARKTPLLLQPEIPEEPTKRLTPIITDNHSRWPEAEVEALIQVRSSVETKFQEPGLKGPLWEEVSSLMASMGYQRSAKRCKEKWENINKYFRKAKESTKKRSQQSKTCSYFDQLDQLYSRTFINSPFNNSSSNEIEVEKQGHSELLEAFIAGKDIATSINPSSGNVIIADMGSSRLEFGGIINEKVERGSHEQEKENHEDYYDEKGEEDRSIDSDEEIGNFR
ncbi:hypothetical protein P3X46_019720 [Hevea brasiliensis]|uniref:Myb-like domain-containing protein n=1 Tax=Hevea brasiliensis TaxID=3981 RepID=A0ABQ9LJK9_HEVBR|nr:trihelix transcription factor DF1 [Hevea brasiliensis]KAJ9168161.1 hypothetical protein P3X46_019720 [Hevea brasiliensis]